MRLRRADKNPSFGHLYGSNAQQHRGGVHIHWFVLFVQTGFEESIINDLKSQLRRSDYTPFIITKEFLFTRKGISEIQRKNVFPGYVFIETSRNASDVVMDFRSIINTSDSKIIRMLNYGTNKENIMIRPSEQAMWLSLVDSDFCIKASDAEFEEGILKVSSGPLLGKEEWIMQVNRHKSKAILKVEFAEESIDMGVVLRIGSPKR